MKGFSIRQKCELAGLSPNASEPKIKCVTVLVFEEAGKTILQPLETNSEALKIHELFQNKTLEVWLPNGKSDPAQFDVSILKYKQMMQPSTMCSKNKTCVCLKNQFETIVSCEQCPLNADGAKD
jgi:hypothetical protein